MLHINPHNTNPNTMFINKREQFGTICNHGMTT